MVGALTYSFFRGVGSTRQFNRARFKEKAFRKHACIAILVFPHQHICSRWGRQELIVLQHASKSQHSAINFDYAQAQSNKSTSVKRERSRATFAPKVHVHLMASRAWIKNSFHFSGARAAKVHCHFLARLQKQGKAKKSFAFWTDKSWIRIKRDPL